MVLCNISLFWINQEPEVEYVEGYDELEEEEEDDIEDFTGSMKESLMEDDFGTSYIDFLT